MRQETRPWGRFEVLYEDKTTWLKRLHIAPGQSLSLQRHKYRSEFWVAQDEGIRAVIGTMELDLDPGWVFKVRNHTLHRLINPCKHYVCVLEWATGHPSEDDIERVADDYGRLSYP